MKTARTVAALRAELRAWRRAGESVGLVPTMGALHAGHLALLGAARSGCRRTVISIFVNPRQFERADDLAAYPRTEAADAATLAAAGADLLFAPPASEIYPEGFATNVSVRGVGDELEGAARPGHFDGVATVVAKLLLQALPDRAYFGEKDWQQLQVVRRLVADLDIPVEIVPVPTVRGPDGLALSSRNVRLSEAGRRIAPRLFAVLEDVARRIRAGEPPAAAAAAGRAALTDAGFSRLDYLEIRGAASLAPATGGGEPLRVLAAAWLGDVRLIDNVAV